MLVLPILSFFAISAALVASSPTSPLVNEKRSTEVTQLENYDYIVVGSGAGGGPLAARLAIYGKKVLLLEAGDDQGATVQESIPAFFAPASEYVPMSWDFFVRHYPNDTREALNNKATYTTPSGETYIGLDPPAGSTLKGIWYPRAGTLGGCGAHNAMVTVYPHEEDWSNIEYLTGDSSWNPTNMRQYFERIENNAYLTSQTNAEASGHGFDGWLGTDEMHLTLSAADPQILDMISATNSVLKGPSAGNITTLAELEAVFPLDLNTDYAARDYTETLYRIPSAIKNGARSSPRDFLLATAAAAYANGTLKYKLDIRTHAFVTKILFDESGSEPRAYGVDFLDGESLYKADARAGSTVGTPGTVNATYEVIISAGTFNTPQLLKLSGIGPKAELEKFDIPVVVNLPDVGANLADHYEISNTVQYETDFSFFNGCTFLETADDPCYDQYTTNTTEKGPYATTLLPVTALLKSSVSGGIRDLFVFGGPINFFGYFQGYTAEALADYKHWSWITLKAHEGDTAGTVTLNSANPLDVPAINFNFYDAGTTWDGADQIDLQASYEGIQFSREIFSKINYPVTEILPGPNVTTEAEIKDFIKNDAWGHHAACTAKIGSVVDSEFRVKGVKNLRVVDASVFPQMPGFFPVLSVYMISEKAADVIYAANP